jgi:hypothetical protein
VDITAAEGCDRLNPYVSRYYTRYTRRIITHLRQGRVPNEQAISQGIVLRVLQEQAWDAHAVEHV